MKELLEQYPGVEKIRLVQDNLNTHSGASFYEAFPAEEAFELAQKFEYHHTPKKGSWLNMVEIELSALAKECLDRRIRDKQMLEKELKALEAERNSKRATVRWRFTKEDARRKFQKFYNIVKN